MKKYLVLIVFPILLFSSIFIAKSSLYQTQRTPAESKNPEPNTTTEQLSTNVEEMLDDLLNQNPSLQQLLGRRTALKLPDATELSEEEQVEFIQNYFERMVQEPITADGRSGLRSSFLLEYLESQKVRVENDIQALRAKLEATWSRRCCRDDFQSVLNEKLEISNSIRRSIHNVSEAIETFEDKIPMQALGSLNETIDGIDYILMTPELRLSWLMQVYLPALRALNLSDEEIAQSIIDGQSLPDNYGGKMAYALDTDNPIAKRNAPYISPTTMCSFNHWPANPLTGNSLWLNLCNGHEADERLNCTEYPQIFSQYFSIEEQSPTQGLFDIRINISTLPRLQSKTDACVGMAFSQELNILSEKQGLFAGSFSMETDGLQLYNQMKEPINPLMCSYESNFADEFMRARENSGGLNMSEAYNRILNDPACLHQRSSRLSVDKISTLLIDDPKEEYPFSFFENLIKSEHGAVVTVYTERGVEQEDWFMYGCESTYMHVAYLVGVGRGVSPFTNGRFHGTIVNNEEPINYVVLRDSFRGKIREYKVPFSNFIKYLSGVHKFHNVTFVPED